MADPALVSDSDPAIIARVLGGARDEFETLVRRHNQRLFRAARAILRSDVEAEDVLQQTWLEVYRHLGQFRGESQFTTWATRIAVNAALAHARKQPVIAEVVDEPDAHTPDEAVENQQLGKILERCLAELPQGSREVTAAALGLSEEAVRVRLHRARSAVAASLVDRIDNVYKFDGARCDRITRHVMAAILL
jgi:RNA polymerase sigma-70 factor (ECF subfamily)